MGLSAEPSATRLPGSPLGPTRNAEPAAMRTTVPGVRVRMGWALEPTDTVGATEPRVPISRYPAPPGLGHVWVRVTVVPVTVREGRVGPLLYQSSVAAYLPPGADARFLVARAPADGSGYAPEAIAPAAVRSTFGPPTDVYRFDGFMVYTWNVNLLTKLRK